MIQSHLQSAFGLPANSERYHVDSSCSTVSASQSALHYRQLLLSEGTIQQYICKNIVNELHTINITAGYNSCGA